MNRQFPTRELAAFFNPLFLLTLKTMTTPNKKATQKKFLNLGNARVKAQSEKMQKIIEHGVCPFCPKFLEKYHDHPIEKIGQYWAVTKNDYPYDGTTAHYLLIHKKHIEHASQITPAAWAELSTIFKWLTKKLKLPAGSFFMRFGDPDYTGASVTHLHAHILISQKNTKQTEALNVPLGYKTKK